MSSLRVLVIEPTRVLAQLVASIVEQVGGRSTLLTSGDEGLASLETARFDVVCCAAVLRGLSSVEFARAVRARQPTLPIVMLTAGQDEEFCHAALAAGITQIVPRSDMKGLADYFEITAVRAAENNLSGRALVVEDSTSIAWWIAEILRGTGLTVVTQPTAEQALRSFDAEAFDVVVTDIVLAGASSGVGLVRELRRAHGKRGSRTPILAVSSLDDPARRVELIRSGVSDFMLKPFLPEELIARVTNLLANKRLLERVEAQQAELRNMALTDQLTQLHNRHFLVEAAATAITEAQRHRHAISLIVLDIDRFKSINDLHGHRTGDAVLSEVAALLRTQCATDDVVARFGGEEFVLLLPSRSIEAAVAKAEHLRKEIERLQPAGIAVTASFGVSSAPYQGTSSFESLFGAADKALYTAKHGGRNRVVQAIADRAG